MISLFCGLFKVVHGRRKVKQMRAHCFAWLSIRDLNHNLHGLCFSSDFVQGVFGDMYVLPFVT